MAIFTKDVSTLVGNILDKEQKISNRIEGLNKEVSELKGTIRSKTRKLAELEVSYDTEQDLNAQRQVRNEIKELRTKIIELEDLQEAYSHDLSNIVLPKREIIKIKEAASKERQARFKKQEDLLQQHKVAKQQLKEMEKKVKVLWNEYERVSSNKSEVDEIKKILKYIEPSSENIRDYNKESYISAWIEDGDAKQYLNF